MKRAIALLGLPLSGKSTLVKMYPYRAIQIGEYAHSLSDDDSMKKRCMIHWKNNTTFDPELVKDLLRNHPFKKTDWYLLDGSPRDEESLPTIQSVFQLEALIELEVNEAEWLRRAKLASNNGRSQRNDSSVPQLLKRKEVYERNMARLRTLIVPHYVIDNSSSLNNTLTKFNKIISEVII